MNENRDLNQRENGINPSELSGKGDYYFSNGVQERTPRTTPVGTNASRRKRQRRKVHLCVLYCGDCGVHGTVRVRRVLYE